MPKCFALVVVALSCAGAGAFAPRPAVARIARAPSRRFSTTIDKPARPPRLLLRRPRPTPPARRSRRRGRRAATRRTRRNPAEARASTSCSSSTTRRGGRVPFSPTTLRRATSVSQVNTREYVSRVLCTKVALTEGEAYDCMMQARAGVPLRGSLGGVSSRSYSLSDDPSSPEPPATRLPERARAERSSLKRRRPQAHQMGMAVVGVYQFEVVIRAGKGCEIPNFKGSYLGRYPLVSADIWTSGHPSERSRSVDAFSGTRARETLTLKRRCIGRGELLHPNERIRPRRGRQAGRRRRRGRQVG